MTQKLCGDPYYNDTAPVQLVGRVSHNASTLLFKVVSLLDETSNNESFGFRDLSFLFMNSSNSSSATTNSVCATAPIKLIKNQCPCNEGQYIDGNGSCKGCSALCSSCFGATSQQCFKCAQGAYFDGVACNLCGTGCLYCDSFNNSKCLTCKTGYYLATNNTCIYGSLFSNSTTNSSNTTNSSGVTSNTTVPATLVPATTSNSSIFPTIASIKNTGNQIALISSLAAGLFGSANPATLGIAVVLKMLPYIRYMEIDYPYKLELLLDSSNSTLVSFSFGIEVPHSVSDKFTKVPLPGKFDKYQLHSSFVVNYWQNLTSFAIVFGIIGVFCTLALFTRRLTNLEHLMQRLVIVVKWNFFLMLFYGNLDGVVLGTCLELITLDKKSLSSTSNIISLCLCLFINICAVFAISIVIYVILDIRKNKTKVLQLGLKQPTEKWHKVQIIHVGYKDDSIAKQIFMFIYLLRIYLFNLIIAYLFNHPLVQTCLLVVLSIFMLSYIISLRPFKSKLVFTQNITDEISLFTINICLLTLAILDSLGIHTLPTREMLGNVIIAMNIGISITSNIYLLAYLFLGLKNAYKMTKKLKKRGCIYWITAFLSPYESGGMDLDIIVSDDEVVLPSIQDSKRVRRAINEQFGSVKFGGTFSPRTQNSMRGIISVNTIETERRLVNQYVVPAGSTHMSFAENMSDNSISQNQEMFKFRSKVPNKIKFKRKISKVSPHPLSTEDSSQVKIERSKTMKKSFFTKSVGISP